jgi:hypothetical protein
MKERMFDATCSHLDTIIVSSSSDFCFPRNLIEILFWSLTFTPDLMTVAARPTNSSRWAATMDWGVVK